MFSETNLPSSNLKIRLLYPASEVQIENMNPLVNGLLPVGKLEMGFGGIMLGYMPMSHKKFHPLLGLDFAWGGYEVYELNTENVMVNGTLTAVTP